MGEAEDPGLTVAAAPRVPTSVAALREVTDERGRVHLTLVAAMVAPLPLCGSSSPRPLP